MFDRGILGINRRNNSYIKEFNPEKWIRLANNKIQTKKFLAKRWIPIPLTINCIKDGEEWESFDFATIQQNSFVIKPNKWSKGRWIIVVKEWKKEEEGFVFLVGGKRIAEHKLKEDAMPILHGNCSSWVKSDFILIEDRLIPWTGFVDFCEYGLADIRIIMFNLVPIIAMLRIPTKESGGKANLAQWWIWLWLDIITGKVTTLYRKWKSYTTTFPEQRQTFKNKKIPYRQEIIQYSANAQYFVNIWYLGMDRVITNKWPRLLEINARAGLEIQNITGKPLLSIMQKIEDLDITTPNKGIEISKSLFSDERISDIREHNIIYLSQTGKLNYYKNNKKRSLATTITVWIDKTKNYTSEKIMKRIISADNITIDIWHKDTIFKNVSILLNNDIQWNKIILWQEILQHYYINPIHKSKVSTRIINPDSFLEDEITNLKILDEKIHNINKQLNLTILLKPTNYLDEFDAFVSHNGKYNPQFTYNFPKYSTLNILLHQIHELDSKYRLKDYFDSSFAQLFFDKLDEMSLKIKLIKAYKKQNFWLIDRYNRELFGEIDSVLLKLSKEKINLKLSFHPTSLGKIIKGNDIIDYIKSYIQIKKLEWIRVRRDDSGLSKIAIWFGKFATIKIKSTAVIREHKLISKLIHEINVHAVRYLNGKKTGRHILTTGTAHYLETEEWLAVYLANKKLQDVVPWYDGISKYKNYYRVDQASRLSFSDLASCVIATKDTFRGRNKELLNYKALFNTLLKFTKWKKDTSIENTWIIFGKNMVYLNGYHKIEKLYQENNAIIKQLTKYGKIKQSDLSFFK